jgi:hypothetical protein
MNIEEMKQALDALELWFNHKLDEDTAWQAHTSLRQAIEAAEKQEPDELTIAYMSGFFDGKKKREWVGLTDEDMRLCLAVADYNQGRYKRTQYWAHLATAIDAKLREKNEC